jgi:hypothetical protein
MKRAPTRRRGVALIIALVILALLAAFSGVLVRGTVSQRRETTQAERRSQARWLAEAAVRRALARLSGDPGYMGETWDVDADQLAGRHGARVTITVAPADGGRADRRRLQVQAEYPPGDDTNRTRETRQLTISVDPGTSGEEP